MKGVGRTPKKIAVLYEDTAYGTTQAQGLTAAAQKLGVEIVVNEAYPLGITDVTPLINKVKASGADIVFPVSYFNDALLLIRSMRQQNITIPAIGGAAGYIIDDFRKGLGEYAEGILSVASANHDLTPELAARFKQKYGVFMTHEAISHAVAVDVLARAVEAAASRDPSAIRDKLAVTDVSDGIAASMPGGGVHFDKTGLNDRTFPVLVQWRGPETVTVYPENVAKAKVNLMD